MADSAVTSACPHAELARDFDPFDLTNPFPFYARARAEAPIFYSPEIDYWVVTRYEEMREIFKDHVTFSSENTQAPYKQRPAEVQQILDDGGFSVVSGLSGKQPPDHTRLRGFIKLAFTPRRVASLEPEIRRIVTAMIDRFADRGEADLVSELAYELPALVIFRMLGIPDADVPDVKEWAQSRVYMNFGDLPAEEQIHHAENLVRYWRYCRRLVQSRIESPQDDLPGDLARIYNEGDQPITPDEIAGMVYGQLTAGHETTTSLLANGLKELLAQRDAWDEICADPSLIPTTVDELLRVSAPVFTWKRRTTRPARIGDADLPAGTNVLMLLGSGNHDESMFPDPDRIDVHRENASRHLSFGLGIHFCLGAPLARLEARVVLEELTRRLPTLRLKAGQTFDFSANSSFRGPSHVFVEWGRAEVSEPDRSTPYALSFMDCPADAAIAGGKGASLASMTAAELPVPPGYVITTESFRAALDANGLRERIAKALRELDAADVSALETRSAELRAMVEDEPIPPAVERTIRQEYRTLCEHGGDEVPVAVRSSATDEDSADTSFAGQQDTYLRVVGEDSVLEHVRKCWGSLYSARAISYRRDRNRDGHNDGDRDQAAIAVVVQRMVDAECSGVAMTIDPVTGDRSRIVIDASFGLGEAVVSGKVTPDHFVLDKVMLEIVESKVSRKDLEIVGDESGRGVIERAIESTRAESPALSAEQAREVAALAKRAERHYGAPQDVEWAIADQQVMLLQSRPETVWASKPRKPSRPAALAPGLTSIVNTLINPLATRRAPDDDSSDAPVR